MAFKIYKQGQGYYTRLVSAIAGSVIALAFAAWLWAKLSVIQSEKTIFIQAGVTIPILAVAAWLIWKFTAVKPASSDFLIDTEGEMRKVNWPTRREVVGSTWVVIIVMVGMMTLLGVTDFLFAGFFRLIGILESTQ